MDWKRRIFVALDGMSLDQSITLIKEINDSPYALMIAGDKAHSLLDGTRENVVARLLDAGAPSVLVDYKLFDTPDTVAERASALAKLGAAYITVHIAGGIEMMRAAMKSGATIIGITEPTSLAEEDVHLQSGHPRKASVLNRARLAHMAGVRHVVCSPHEVAILAARRRFELEGMRLITPGIRLKGKEATDDNQKQVDTPEAAFRGGADYIVLGSALTKAPDPLAVLATIKEQMEKISLNT